MLRFSILIDFVVLLLTVYCSCVGYLRAKRAGLRSRLWRVILKDGRSCQVSAKVVHH